MPVNGLSLGIQFRQRLNNTDALAGIPFALRLQTHKRQVSHYVDAIRVSGASQPNANGLYFFVNPTSLSSGRLSEANNALYIIYAGGSGDTWLLGDTSANYYNATPAVPLPPVTINTWTGGITVTAERVPFYKPLGLYKDIACTLPATQEGDSIAAWRDELSGSGLVATQSNSMKQPTLHFVDGVPTVKTDGVDDLLVIATVQARPFTAFIACKVDVVNGGTIGRILSSAGGSSNWLLGSWGSGSTGSRTSGAHYADGWVSDQIAIQLDDDWHVTHCLEEDGFVGSSVWVDGSLESSSGNAFGTWGSELLIGGYENNEHASGCVTSVVVASSILDQANAVSAYLATLNPV